MKKLLVVLSPFAFLILNAPQNTDRTSNNKTQAPVDHKYEAISSEFDWSQQSRSFPTLTAGKQATVSLTPCPRGVDASGSPSLGGPQGAYPVYIEDGKDSEASYVVGGSCTSGAASGTVIFIPHSSHAAGRYTLRSASAGIQEAINATCGADPKDLWGNGNCRIVISPTGPELRSPAGNEIYDTIFFHANNSTLSGYGAILNCRGRGPCLQIGNLQNSNHNGNNTIEGVTFRPFVDHPENAAFAGSHIISTQRISGVATVETEKPHELRTGDRVTQMFTDQSNYWGDVPSIKVVDATHYTYPVEGRPDLANHVGPGVTALTYAGILDNGFPTSFLDIHIGGGWGRGSFNNFFDVWDDENASVERFNNSAMSMTKGANWSGSFFFSGGQRNLPVKAQQLAPVISIKNTNITANYSNCVTVFNSNGLYIKDTVCQGSGPWQFNVSNITGNYQGADFENIYSESSPKLNPKSPVTSPWPGLGIAGLIGGATSGGWTYKGQGNFQGALPTEGTGSTTYVYFIVAHDVTAKTVTSPMPVMYSKENSPTTTTVSWPRVANEADSITYDILRVPAPQGTMAVAHGGFAAPYTGGCSGGVRTCGSIATGITQCPGFVCTYTDNTGKETSAYEVGAGGFAATPRFWPGPAVLTSSALSTTNEIQATGIAFGGNPVVYTGHCSWGASVSGGPTVCYGTAGTNSLPTQPAMFLTDGGYSGGNMLPNAKGRLNFAVSAGVTPSVHHIITLVDSNPSKTRSTTGYRPVADPGDTWIGLDSVRSLSDVGLGIGASNSISSYIGNVGDNKSWKERLTDKQKTFAVPVVIQNGTLTVGAGSPLSQMKVYKTNGVQTSSVPAQTCADVKEKVPGLSEADQITGLKPPKSLGNLSVNGYASAADTLTLHFCNPTSSPVNIPPGAYSFLAVH